MKNLLLTASATLILAFTTLAQTVPSYVPTNGLVGWWPFNGNANDESGNGNNGTVNGATLTEDRFGNANTAYSFDGVDDFIDIGNSALLDFSNGLSISGWLYCNSLGGKIIEQCDLSNFWANYQFRITESGQLRVGLRINNVTTAYTTTTNVLSSNQWYHIGVTWGTENNGGLCKIFINGIESEYQEQNPLSTSIGLELAESTKFGADIHAPFEAFQGSLDDIGIWNRALTQEEITNLYNGNICFETVTVTDTLLINMGIVGYNPISYSNTIRIFPNPSNDHITIDYGDFASLSGYQLRIDNSLGQQMFQTAINQQSSYISLSTWTGNGLYFVHVIDPQGNTIDIRKIVLQ